MPKASRPVTDVTKAELIKAREILFDSLRQQLKDPQYDARMREVLRSQAGRAAKLYGMDDNGEFDAEFPPPKPCEHRCAEHGDPKWVSYSENGDKPEPAEVKPDKPAKGATTA
jgi:hypothetical protein